MSRHNDNRDSQIAFLGGIVGAIVAAAVIGAVWAIVAQGASQ